MMIPNAGFNSGNAGIPRTRTAPLTPRWVEPLQEYRLTPFDINDWVTEGSVPPYLKWTSGELIPPGRYIAMTTDDYRSQNSNGKCFYRLLFEVTSGPFKGAVAGRTCWVTENGLASANEFCKHLGFSSLEAMMQADVIAIDYQIDIEHGKDERGRDVNVVQRILPYVKPAAGVQPDGQEGGGTTQ
jgi:hypothetical protein